MRNALSVLIVVLLFAGMIARLRRIPRPRFEPTESHARGKIVVGRVYLARRGERGQFIGWSVLCDGHEVRARLMDRAWIVSPEMDDRVHFLDPSSGGRFTVASIGCTVRPE